MTGQPVKLRDKAYAEFTRHLFQREIRPGQFVSQRELVALTGMPLGAIRELVPRLMLRLPHQPRRRRCHRRLARS